MVLICDAVLFRKTFQRNAELEARVLELERELSVWKLGFASNDEEKVALRKQVTKLERSIGSLKVCVAATDIVDACTDAWKRTTTRLSSV